MKYYINIILIILIVIIASCGKKEDEICPTEFELPGTIYPYKQTYHLGDTITLISKYSKYVYEKKTKEYYNIETISVSYQFGICRIDSGNNIQINKKDIVDIISCSDTNSYWSTFSSSGSEIYNMKQNLINDSNITFLKILLKKRGLFKLEFGGGLINSKQYFEGKCSNYSFDVYMRLNNPKDNNINLLKESPYEYYNDWLPRHKDNFYNKGSFVFKVIE